MTYDGDNQGKDFGILINGASSSVSARWEWRLAPAYDLTYSADPGNEHYLDVGGEGRAPCRGHVLSLCRRHGLGDRAIDTIIDEVRAAVNDWPRYAADAAVSRASRADIRVAHETVSAGFFS